MIGVLGPGGRSDRLLDALGRTGSGLRFIEPGSADVPSGLDGVDALLIRDSPDLDAEQAAPIVRAALDKGLPVRAIGHGMLLLNQLAGGSTMGDIAQHFAPSVPLRYQVAHGEAHDVAVLRGSRLFRALGDREAFTTASPHSAGIASVAPGFVAVATAADGIVEAIEKRQAPGVQGLQSLPADDALLGRWVQAFVGEAPPPSPAVNREPNKTGRSPSPPPRRQGNAASAEPMRGDAVGHASDASEPRKPTKLANDIRSQSIRHAARRGKTAMEKARDFTHYGKSIHDGQEALVDLAERARNSTALQLILDASLAAPPSRASYDMLMATFEAVNENDAAADKPDEFVRFVIGKVLSDSSEPAKKRQLIAPLMKQAGATPLLDVARDIASSGVDDHTACAALGRAVKKPDASLATFGSEIQYDVYDAAQRNRVHRILLSRLRESTDANTAAVAKAAFDLRQIDGLLDRDNKSRVGNAALERMGRGLLVEPTPEQSVAGFYEAAVGAVLGDSVAMAVGASAMRTLHDSTNEAVATVAQTVTALAGAFEKRNNFYSNGSTVTLYKTAFRLMRAGLPAEKRAALEKLSTECCSALYNDDERKFMAKRIAEGLA